MRHPKDFPTGYQYRIDLPLGHPRARHPHDQPLPDSQEVLNKSSGGQHMVLTSRRTPSQQGAHFDNPYHFNPDGSREETGPIGGLARVIDLRPFLLSESDGHAITSNVVEAWLSSAGNSLSKGDTSWGIVGVRTLTDAESAQEAPLATFPFWENPAAVKAFLDGIREATDTAVQAILNEPASVDRVDEGFLLDPNPDTGRGGAHGAFGRRNVAIGEFFDFKGIAGQGQRGRFTAVRGISFPDSTPLSVAWFVPDSD